MTKVINDSYNIIFGNKKCIMVAVFAHHDLLYIDVTKNIETTIKAHVSHSTKYSFKEAQESENSFIQSDIYPSNKRFERFSYVIAD